ncbi:MAG: hypothetical protein KUG81_08590 [Gammaproteobacteria bacterium]|nr:hypothetical protein [Gammaproteobacteria bacterium]
MQSTDLKNNIIDRLRELIKTYPEDNRFSMQKAINDHLWEDSTLGKIYFELISSKKEYAIFDDHLQTLGNGTFNTTIEGLVDWTLNRGRKIGADKAICELDAYVSSTEVKVDLIELMVGVYLDCEFEFSNEVRITSPNNISDSSLANAICNESFGTRTPLPQVTAVTIVQFDQPIEHTSNTDIDHKLVKVELPTEKLRNVRLCLSLARPIEHGINSIASGVIAPDNLPFVSGDQSWSIIPFKHPPLAPSVLKCELERANQILSKFELLDPIYRNKLLIPLDKLNSFGSSESLVDRAIYLRISLESIFLTDGNKDQLRYRLALRAALFLESTLEDRKKVFNIIKDAYDITSSAVHNGKFSKSDKIETLTKAANLTKTALIKLIDKGKVNWEDLELQN